ncbi:MAG: ABC transporter permease [Thomasclavelia sp.]|uniref:ABC transporter permease n=1 Tax=Thomasclavelia sp. TaxID=3025757 RepID=UPI0039A2226C
MDLFYFLFRQSLMFSIPLLIVALGGLFSERSGIINIALEGIMIFGAFFGILFMFIAQNNDWIQGQLLFYISLIVSGIVGGLFALLHAFAAVNMKADQTISGTALNLFAPALGIFIAKTIFGGVKSIPFTNEFLIKEIPFLSNIPIIGEMFFKDFYVSTFIGIIILILTYVFLYKTKTGLRIRTCGENPHAADAAGINVYKMRYLGVVLSGVLAGIGGLVYVIPITSEYSSTVAGYGFLALAVLIFGNWNPWRIALSAIFFAFAKTLAVTYASIPFLLNSGIPGIIFRIFPYLATLILLAFTSKNSAAPKAAGEPFDKSKR